MGQHTVVSPATPMLLAVGMFALRRVSRRVGTYTFGGAVGRSLKRRCHFRLKGGTQTELPE